MCLKVNMQPSYAYNYTSVMIFLSRFIFVYRKMHVYKNRDIDKFISLSVLHSRFIWVDACTLTYFDIK